MIGEWKLAQSTALIGALLLLTGCVGTVQQETVVAVAPPAAAPTQRRIVHDGSGFILPDGTRVADEGTGGFTLPNGTYLAPDTTGRIALPNGAVCVSDGARGYVCP